MKLYKITEEFEKLEGLLMTGEVTEESEALLTELMTTEGHKLDGYLMVWANLKALAEGADLEAKRLARKKKTALNAIESMKARLTQHFIATNTNEVTRPLGKIKLRTASKAAFVVDAGLEDMPDEFRQVVTGHVLLKDHLAKSIEIAVFEKNETEMERLAELAHFEPKKRFIQIY